MLGSVQKILVCQPSTGVTGFTPCPDGYTPVTVDAYLLAPSAQAWVESANSPLDTAQLGGLLVAGFSVVLLPYVFAYLAKQVIKQVR